MPISHGQRPPGVAAIATVLAVALVLAAGGGAAAEPPPRAAIRSTLAELAVLGKQVDRAYAPFRRGAPADTTVWSRLDELQETVTGLAGGARRLRAQVGALREEPGFEPAVRPAELRRRLSLADSLLAGAERAGSVAWRELRPRDAEEARGWVARHARATKQAADRAAAAAADLAYAVGVTEGVGERTLNLSLVGLVVVFGVLALIALVVGLIRRLDDGWQAREQAADAAALVREPTIDQTTLVLIAAACATLITGRFRVRRIRRLLSPHQKRTPWSAQGRLILQGSHTVDRKSN